MYQTKYIFKMEHVPILSEFWAGGNKKKWRGKMPLRSGNGNIPKALSTN